MIRLPMPIQFLIPIVALPVVVIVMLLWARGARHRRDLGFVSDSWLAEQKLGRNGTH
jgi:hypothetical protein